MAPTAMVGWATLGTGDRVELASPGRRLGARLIDWIIFGVIIVILAVVAVASAVSIIGDDPDGGADQGAAVLLVVFLIALIAFVISLLYEVTLVALRGQTLGKMATGIKVVRADSGSVPGWGKAIGRWVIPSSFVLIPYAGLVLSWLVYLSLLWDKTRQGWHDKAAGTVVIKL